MTNKEAGGMTRVDIQNDSLNGLREALANFDADAIEAEAAQHVPVLPELEALYLDNLQAAGRSPLTLTRYREVIDKFRKSLGGKTTADPLDVRDFLDTIRSPNTRTNSLVVLRQWFKFLTDQKIARSDPSRGIPLGKFRRRNAAPVTEEDLTRLLDAFAQDPAMQVLATILYRVGPRIRETCAMRTEHVSFDGDYGTIDFPERKGGQAGFAAFGPEVTYLLRPWVATQSGWVFPSRTGHTTHKWVETKFRRASKRARLAVPITPHLLRHSYITSAVEAGWSQLALQQQIGHSNPISTSWYYRPSRQGLIRISKRLHGVPEENAQASATPPPLSVQANIEKMKECAAKGVPIPPASAKRDDIEKFMQWAFAAASAPREQEELGVALRKVRERLGLSQEELAKAAGIPHSQTISQIERGDRDVKAAELVAIAEGYIRLAERLKSLRSEGVREGRAKLAGRSQK
jgi:site-specific recombinase XerD/DNA-binding XRE family transcriptional regulator